MKTVAESAPPEPRQTDASRRAFAEAPAAQGDFALCLARWDELRVAGAQRQAPVFCARYLALTGQLEAAGDMALKLLAADPPPELLNLAVTKFYVPGLGGPWVRAVSLCRAKLKWEGEERSAHLSRLGRADFLLDLDGTERALALDLLADLDDPALVRGHGAELLALAGAYGPSAEVRRLLELLAPPPQALEEAARKVLRRYEAGSLPIEAVLAFAAAFEAEPTVFRTVSARITGLARGDAALRLIMALPMADWSAFHLRGAIFSALGTAEGWIVSERIRRMAAQDPGALLPLRLAEELAAQTGDIPLSLALCLVNSTDTRDPLAAPAIADRLTGLGFRRLAVALLAHHDGQSEPSVFRRAQLLWRGPPETRHPQSWKMAAALHDSPRIRRGLAAAVAEEGDYDAARGLFLSGAEPEAGSLTWRDRAITLERVGLHSKWGELISELETAHPEEEWVRGERLKHDIETGRRRGAALGQPELGGGTGKRQSNLHARRALVRQVTVQGLYNDAVEMWRGIAAETRDPNDHYNLILALCQAGAFDSAAQLLDELRGLFPGEYRYHLKRAQLFERDGDYARTLTCFAQALETEPGNRDSLAGIARCLTYLDRPDRCDAWLDNFPDEGILFAWVHAARAFNAARAARPEAARAALFGLHGLTRRALGEIEAQLAAEPGAMWLHGRLLEGRSARAARTMEHFGADWRWLQEGRPLIVGNSPQLLASGLGRRIDGFDRVVRLNDFQTLGHEADVGTRTDLWFSSANRLAKPNADQLQGTRIWISQPNAQHFPDLETFVAGRLGLQLDEGAATFLPPHIHYLSTSLIYPRPSTGFRMISIMEFFLRKKYNIVGFGFFQDESIHYFDADPGRFQVGEVHAINFERDFVKEVLPLSDFFENLEYTDLLA
jgi:tetratricopeptide (TPR) repeat protein